MKLGILVNTDRHAKHIIGLTKAAVKKGHKVSIFIMNSGVNLLSNASITGLSRGPGVSISYCDYSVKKIGVPSETFPDEIVCGSQYDNSIMQHESDRVIVL